MNGVLEPVVPDLPILIVYETEYEASCKEAADAQESSAVSMTEAETFLADPAAFVGEGQRVFACASLNVLKRLFAAAEAKKFVLGIIPGKGQSSLARFTGLPGDPKKAFETLAQTKPRPLDILYANGQIVLYSALIGEAPPFSYKSAVSPSPVWKRLGDLFSALRRLGSLNYANIKLKTKKEQEIATAATGVIVIEHDRSSCAANLVRPLHFLNEGKLAALVISPESILGYLKYLMQAFFALGKNGTLPPSVGLIKSESLQVEAQPALELKVDGEAAGTTPVTLAVKSRAFQFCAPETFWASAKDYMGDKETVRLGSLPTSGEGVDYRRSSLPLLSHAGEERFRQLFPTLREEGRTSAVFVILMVLSTLLATLGLFLSSASVVIGAMVLAPLMQPMISLSMGLLRLDGDLLLNGFKTVLIGIGLVLASSAVVTLLMPFDAVTPEISARLSPTLLDLLVAVVSGIAAAYAKSNEKIAASLAGVAIAVALVPPLSTAGIGLGWQQWDIFLKAFLLFWTNLVGIVLAAAVTFLLLGYAPIRMARKGLLVAVSFVLAVCVPLYFSFSAMVEEGRIVQMLQSGLFAIETTEVQIENVRLRHRQDHLVVRCDLLADRPLESGEMRALKGMIETRIGRKILFEPVSRLRL